MDEVTEDYEDAELDTECRMLGSLMLSPETRRYPRAGIAIEAFCVPFHAAVYQAVMLLTALGREPIPTAVWALVEQHPDAEDFGLQHVIDLATDAAAPDRFALDCVAVATRGFQVAASMLSNMVEARSHAKH